MAGVSAEMRAHEYQVEDVCHAGTRLGRLLQQRGHQRMQVPAVACWDGRKLATAGIIALALGGVSVEGLEGACLAGLLMRGLSSHSQHKRL